MDEGLKVPTTTRFTPGPWYADDEVVLAGRERVAQVVPWTRGIHLANARLIAAAPELYDALLAIWNATQPREVMRYDGYLMTYDSPISRIQLENLGVDAALTKATPLLEPSGQPE